MNYYHALVMSDTHSGDAAGLTQYNMGHQKHHWWQETMRNWWRQKLEEIGPVDDCIHLGETLEGPGKRSTLELVLPDVEEQAEHAGDLLDEVDAQNYLLNYASNYHSSGEGRYEHMVVKRLRELGNKADIRKHQRVEVYGTKIDTAHKVGGSRTAYGQGTQLAKGAVLDILRQVYNEADPAHIYFRAHNHYYYHVGNDLYTAYNLPAMKWPHGAYGVEIDGPFYTLGMLELTVWEDGTPEITEHLLRTKYPETQYQTRRGHDRKAQPGKRGNTTGRTRATRTG